MTAPKTHYSATELSTMNLPGLPRTARGVEKMSSRCAWSFREVAARGGRTGTRREYAASSLPPAARQAILERQLSTVTSSAPVAPAGALPATPSLAGLLIPSSADLTDDQRIERDARAFVVSAIRRLQVEAACSQEASMQTLLAMAASGRADPGLVKSLQLARDARGRKGLNGGLPSIRTFKRWLSAGDLTPRIVQRDMSVPRWAKLFLERYQQPQKPSVQAAYRDACSVWTAEERPSIHQVRRFLDKLGTITRERGRMGPRELKNLQPFIRRDFSLLEPNDIWTADGHTFDAEVQHPLHGRPFRPEITSILDIATRRCVGWSVDLSESALAVVDAIRCGAERAGLPAIFYVDRGSGYDNALLKAEGTGLQGRLGFEVKHSLPYNSQARGVIERFHQTVWVAGAKMLPSYMGAAMDREARLQQFKLTRGALKKGGAMPLIPWDLFVPFVEARVAEYNARPHRSLNGTSPDLAWKAFEARGWQICSLAAAEVETLFRPRVTRTIQRAEINLFTNIYFARALEEFHGLEAQIAYDIHDPTRIWVYTLEGRFICEAQVNGNRRHYFPVPVVDQAREKRAKGRLGRLDLQREEVLEELHGGPALAAPAPSQIVIGGRIIDPEAILQKRQAELPAEQIAAIPAGPSNAPAKSRTACPAAENYADWLAVDARIQAGENVSEADARWHRSYPNSAQYKAHVKKMAANPGRVAA